MVGRYTSVYASLVHPGRYTRPYMPVYQPVRALATLPAYGGVDTSARGVEEERPPEAKRGLSPPENNGLPAQKQL